MPVLHFGVVDVPYASSSYQRAPKASKNLRLGAPKRPKRDPSGASNAKTTGDVAEILEARYHIFETFYETLGADVIAASLEHSLNDAIQDIQAGAPARSLNITMATEQELETAFQIFIDQEEMNGNPGVPTMAAIKGVNHRFMHPYAKGNPSRPSFRDTGLYMASFKVWITGSSSQSNAGSSESVSKPSSGSFSGLAAKHGGSVGSRGSKGF